MLIYCQWHINYRPRPLQGEKEKKVVRNDDERERHAANTFSALCIVHQHLGHIWDKGEKRQGGTEDLTKKNTVGAVGKYEQRFLKTHTQTYGQSYCNLTIQ